MSRHMLGSAGGAHMFQIGQHLYRPAFIFFENTRRALRTRADSMGSKVAAHRLEALRQVPTT